MQGSGGGMGGFGGVNGQVWPFTGGASGGKGGLGGLGEAGGEGVMWEARRKGRFSMCLLYFLRMRRGYSLWDSVEPPFQTREERHPSCGSHLGGKRAGGGGGGG